MYVIDPLTIKELALHLKEHFRERLATDLVKQPVVLRLLDRSYKASYMSQTWVAVELPTEQVLSDRQLRAVRAHIHFIRA